MEDHNKSVFDERAADWDEEPRRVKLANEVADAIIREINPGKDMNALEYGCGSGLVTLRIQPFIKSITGVDSSKGMLDVLKTKVEKAGIKNIKTLFVDFEQGGKVEGNFNLIFSSMTLHHINEPAQLLKQFYNLLLPGGFLGIADLDKEDGTYHSNNASVHHFGFDRDYLKGLFRQAGFKEVRDVTATTVVKEIAEKGKRNFPIFLITGKK